MNDNNFQKRFLVAPSILAADFLNLEAEIGRLEATDAEFLHLDIMDGNFVPNISFGPEIVRRIKKICTKKLDVHLMISNPEKYIKEFAEAGADFLTFHIEAAIHPDRILQQIKSLGMKAGIALNPGTHLFMIEFLLEKLDLILIMSVNPGFGGQKFIPEVASKANEIRKMVLKRGLKMPLISIDGGVCEESARFLKDFEIDLLVAGSFIFKEEKKDYQSKINKLR